MNLIKNLHTIQQQIVDTTTDCQRDTSAVQLLIASKTRSAKDISPLLEHGHFLFGENKIQETQEKWPALRLQYPEIELHLIGHLQTNKAKEACDLFDVIETLDSERLAKALKKEQDKSGKELSYYIQVNTGDEQQKHGISPTEFDGFYNFCVKECGLNVTGVMCIPPMEGSSALHFALLSNIAKKYNLPNISMGMSQDFETAIRFGTTHIRIGTALFGKRL